MADNGKLDLPDDILSSNQSDRAWTGKVEVFGGSGGEKVLSAFDESKDLLASENSIPLSPQWLYAKPTDSKMEMRPLNSVGHPAENNQKDGRRLEGSEEKKDRRRVNMDSESSRRWREEERETNLIAGRRDRRKPERRDSVSMRETTESRMLPSSERWNETRRDSKWSSRWGPEEKDKESRVEKRADVEKEETHPENQTIVSTNRSASERDLDSRDKWRPRHRMEAHPGGSATNRAAPGFGPERGKVEGSNVGFTLGRGRGNLNGRSSSLGPIGCSESVPGKLISSAGKFCYPRGKLLDLYRLNKLDQSFATMPKDMEELLPLTKEDLSEPFAFVAPDTEEEEILSSILRGKITSSGVAYSNSYKMGKSTERMAEHESEDGILDTLNKEPVQEVANDDGALWNYDLKRNMVDGENGDRVDKREQNNRDGLMSTVSENNNFSNEIEIGGAYRSDFQNNNDAIKHKAEPSFELENEALPEDICLCYLDPQGVTQGPFLVVDIISWFEQRFFGIELPVRLADAPEGTPFQYLGEMLPHLRALGGNAENMNRNVEREELDSFGVNVGPTVSSSASVFGGDSSLSFPELNSFSGELAQLRLSKPEDPQQLPHFNGQSFHELTAQDEGRPMHTGFPTGQSSGNAYDQFPGESGLRDQTEAKMHPFGLLWSELEGAQTKHAESLSNMPRTSAFADSWADVYSKSRPSDPNVYQDVMNSHNFSRETGHPDLADQLLSQQMQQQKLQQQNMLSAYGQQLNEQVIDHMPGQHRIHQQHLGSLSATELDHLMNMKLQMQQQQHRQLQLQQQQQQHQFLQRQKRQQEQQQQSHAQQILGQLLQGQMHDVDAIRASSNVLDQALLEQQLLHQLEHQSRNPHGHTNPSLEQLILAKLSQSSQFEHQRDPLEAFSHAQHGQLHSLENQIRQHELLQARQLSLGVRQRSNLEEEMHMNSLWPADQPNQMFHRAQSSGFGPLDIYQHQQRSSPEEQLSHLERNFQMQEQLRQGRYEHGSHSFERAMSLPHGAPDMNPDVVNALSRARGMNIHPHDLHQSIVPNEGHWSEKNDQLQNNFAETRFQHLHMAPRHHHQERETEVKVSPKDSTLWMSDRVDEEKSKRLLMELLKPKSSNQLSVAPEEGNGTENTVFTGQHPISRSPEVPFTLNLERETNLKEPFGVRGYGSSSQFEPPEEEHARAEKPFLKSESGSSFLDKERLEMQAFENEGVAKGWGFKGQQVVDQQDFAGSNEERSVNTLSRHPSLGSKGASAGMNKPKFGSSNSFLDDIAKDQESIMFKGQENILLRRPPVSRTPSSLDGLSEIVPDPVPRGKVPSSRVPEGVRQDTGNPMYHGQESMASLKRDAHFRRSSSSSDVDVSEASFSDMLKSNTRKTTPAETFPEPSDGMQGRSGKKKGKKGKQIDPALLGFKVTSNRIMMGEIQRVED